MVTSQGSRMLIILEYNFSLNCKLSCIQTKMMLNHNIDLAVWFDYKSIQNLNHRFKFDVAKNLFAVFTNGNESNF